MDRSSRLFIDTERVIAAVRARPNIWLPTDDNYKNKKQRALAWTAVCHQVLDQFDQYTDEDQKELEHVSEKRVQQRWRTARDCFVKARVRPSTGSGTGTGAGTGSAEAQYVFMEQLTFLEPSLRHTRPLLPVRKHQLAVDDQIRKSKRIKQTSVRPAAVAVASTAAAASETDEEGSMSAFERSLLCVLKRTASPLQDDDESFFRSLAPTLAALDSRHKLLFRSRVLATALDLQAQYTAVFLEGPPQTCDINLQEEEPPEQKYRPPQPPQPPPRAARNDTSADTDSSSS